MKPTELLSILTDRREGVGILQRLRQARESLRMRRVLEDFPPLKERRSPERTPRFKAEMLRQPDDDDYYEAVRTGGFDYSPEPIEDDEPDRNRGPFTE